MAKYKLVIDIIEIELNTKDGVELDVQKVVINELIIPNAILEKVTSPEVVSSAV